MTDAVLTFLVLAIVCIWAKYAADCADEWLIHPPGSLAEKIDEEEREMKNKLVAKFNPDGTLKSLTGDAPNLNALAQLCVNVIYKMASDGYLDEAEILVERCRQAVRMAEEEQG